MKFKLSTLAIALLPALAISNTVVAANNVVTPNYSDKSLIVTYKKGTSQATQARASRGTKTKRFQHILGGRLSKLTVRSGDIHVLMKRLRKHPAIESVELDHFITINEPAAAVDDVHYDKLWGMKNTGQDINGSIGVEGADIDAEAAWLKTTGSKDVVIGVLDTGIDYTHEDLADNMWTNPGEIAGDGIDNDGNGYIDDIHGWDAYSNDGDPMDEGGHGTHVAGTIGAVGNNGIGVTGVSQDVSMIGCRFLGAEGGTTSGAIECLNYMLAVKSSGVNIKVTNNSWGGGGYSAALVSAIQANNDAGILFVAAAGNSATDNDAGAFYPSNYDVANVLAIASTTNKDKMSGFSQWGLTTVDMGAPGSDIASTYPAALNGGNTGYVWMSGTSMATPYVTGAAALLASIDENMTVAEMKQILMDSGDSIDALAGKTVSGKRLNVANAIDMATPVTGYQLEAAVTEMQVIAGDTATFILDTVARLDWDGSIALSTSGDLAASVTPSPVTAGQSAELSVPTTADTAFGQYNVVVEGETEGQLDSEGNAIKDRSLAFVVDVLPQSMEEFTFAKNESIDIPDGDANGIQSIITLGDDITTINTKVSINIPTGDSGDFIITLTSPTGTNKTVYDRQNTGDTGLVAEFDLGRAFYGETIAGDWTLTVVDKIRLDRATFKGWTMTFEGVGELLPAAPTTDFSYAAEALTISFTDLSTDNNNDIVSWAWDFGDGNSSEEQNPIHTFTSNNGFEVSLTATDARGESTTKTKTVWASAQSIDLEIPRQYLSRSGTLRNKLVWSGSEAETVTITRNGVAVATDIANTGRFTDSARRITETSFEYQICDSNDVCSPIVLVEF
jgi:subtilisin family serine protease/PKD repeat protein